MTDSWRQQIEQVLDRVSAPYIDRGLVAASCIESLVLEGATTRLSLVLGFPAAGIADSLAAEVRRALQQEAGLEQVEVDVKWAVPDNCAAHSLESIPGVRNIVAIASGKGGVGKSTCAVNLALALTAEGAKVGLLDGDIYGPSQQVMLGIDEDQRPAQHGDQFLLPIEAHGLKTMSMAYLTTEKTPMVWRGPMASGAMQQMIGQTLWQELDYLIVDMPPGTGDIQLTLAQRVPVSGAVIVTTPQDIALIDAVKGVEMFNKVDVPVLGVIENMAWHNCTACGHREYLFGEGGGERLASEYAVNLLGSLPLELSIREQTDSGNPTVVADPEGEISAIYRDMARQLGAALWQRSLQGAAPAPLIETVDD